MGSPTPRERHGDRATVVVGGVTTSQGVPESGAQGKGWQEEPLLTAWSWEAGKCVSPSLFSLQKEASSGKRSALRGACSVWERGVGNVLTPRVRERRLSVSITLASPFGNAATRQLPIS